MKVFLGGTCAETTWRDELWPHLRANGIDFFNPVVKDWTYDCQLEEYKQKEECDVHLYVITKEMVGVFSIAEVVDSVHQEDKKTILNIIIDGFDTPQTKSLYAVSELVTKRGGEVYVSNRLGIDWIMNLCK